VFQDSRKKEMSLKFAQYLLSPEGQGLVASAKCYAAMPVNKKALLSNDTKLAMQWESIDSFLANSYDYGAVDESLDKAMNDVWTEFLAR
jgi:spermidine/putrescine transport system substrate-binding protein